MMRGMRHLPVSLDPGAEGVQRPPRWMELAASFEAPLSADSRNKAGN